MSCLHDDDSYSQGFYNSGSDSGNPGSFAFNNSGGGKSVTFATLDRTPSQEGLYNGLGAQTLTAVVELAEEGGSTEEL